MVIIFKTSNYDVIIHQSQHYINAFQNNRRNDQVFPNLIKDYARR